MHRRELDGRELVFGNQGDLYRNAMTWWDHDTGTIWSQPRAEAILGPRTGETLEVIPFEYTTWAAWRDAHPRTLALDAPAGASGFEIDQLAIVVELGGEARAYTVFALRERPVINDELGGTPLAVVLDGDSWRVYARELDGWLLDLAWDDGLVDRSTGSRFDLRSDRATSGPLDGTSLVRLPGLTSYPKDVRPFWPDATFWSD